MTQDFANVYDDATRAESYDSVGYPATYYLAFRDLPSLLAEHVAGTAALDFGCGAGRSTRFLRELGFQVVGVDIAEEMLVRARPRDPGGEYRLVPDGDLSSMAGQRYDLILCSFTFDNVPTAEKKVALFQALAGMLNEGGRIVNLVSAPAIYVNEGTSFSTRDFPENRRARNGDRVRIVMLDVPDRRPVEDVLCTDAGYHEVYARAGLFPVVTHSPLGEPSEPYPWVSETRVSPWAIYVLAPGAEPGQRSLAPVQVRGHGGREHRDRRKGGERMAGGEDGSYDIVPGEDPPDRPRVVDEADEVLTTYAWQLIATAGVVAASWVGAGFFGASIPPLLPILIFLMLLILYMAPVTREPRLSREVLRRWDRLRVERALESSGITGDPRLEVAESMADRVLRHPSVDQRVRDATSSLVSKLRMVIRDLRRVEYLTDARGALSQREMTRSISDLQDLLDARAAELIGQIAELHRTVVLRDAAALERVVTNVEDLVNELEAEREVERLLSDAERS